MENEDRTRSRRRARILAAVVGLIGLYYAIAITGGAILWPEEIEPLPLFLVVAVVAAAAGTSWLAWHFDRRSRWAVLILACLTAVANGLLLPGDVQVYAWPGYVLVAGVGFVGFRLLSGLAINRE
jgi:predicted permease